jgi:uncharacterized membrane protein
MPVDPQVAHHRAVIAANVRWSRPGARAAHADKIRRARLAHHEQLVDPDGTLDPAERTQLAENSLKAEMARLALKSAQARRLKRRTAAAGASAVPDQAA